MAEAFESEMQSLVNNYKCEWKEVVETPELRKRFNHFVNAPAEKDPEVHFDTMRGQKKAKEWK
jgi:nitrite reductase (NADH) large subunit